MSQNSKDESQYHHLSLDERKDIERFLNISGILLKTVSASIGKTDKCIRYEIKRHRIVKVNSRRRNKCGKQNRCEKMHLCNLCIRGKCVHCHHRNCNELCDDYTDIPDCRRLNRFPYVCNSCDQADKCELPKYIYYAERAQNEYTRDKLSWRMGYRKSDEELLLIKEAFEREIPNKKSLDVIIHDNDLPISPATAYRYIRGKFGGFMNIDLKRQVRYKSRQSRIELVPLNYDYLGGRRYEDFLKRIGEDSYLPIWEMDTVEGKKGTDEKSVLSLLHRQSNLQLFFLLERHDVIHVTQILDQIKLKLGSELFRVAFPIILTDNGTEFKDPLVFEADPDTGEILISVYYCEPRRSDEKGKCEKNHEHFREMVPKGISMNPLSQKDISYVSLMVNNYSRKLLNYHSPIEIASLLLHEKVLALNDLHPLDKSLVRLTPVIK